MSDGISDMYREMDEAARAKEEREQRNIYSMDKYCPLFIIAHLIMYVRSYGGDVPDYSDKCIGVRCAWWDDTKKSCGMRGN